MNRDDLRNALYNALMSIFSFVGVCVVFYLLLLMVSSAYSSAKENPTFECRAWSPPRIVCEARFVDPYVPEWRVYYWNSKDTADFDRGTKVYLTIPYERFAEIEMTVRGSIVSAFARWHNGKVEFKEAP